MSVRVFLVENDAQLDLAHRIRYDVFVIEQHVPVDDELDDHEKDSRHFIALDDGGAPCGAARWRFTDLGVKLERFAVLKTHRNQGIGSALVNAVIDDIRRHPGYAGQMTYLHAQLNAVPLYKKFGFEITGGIFKECDIEHYKMTKARL
jgi:predicted GNAT family N-acyltransferase